MGILWRGVKEPAAIEVSNLDSLCAFSGQGPRHSERMDRSEGTRLHAAGDQSSSKRRASVMDAQGGTSRPSERIR